jgi:heme-degrading monooxygenase HmoA
LIVRVLEGRVHSGRVTVFRQQAKRVLEDARREDGLVHAQIARQVNADGGEEIIFVSVWRDLEALYGWLGTTDLLNTPVFNGGTFDVFEHFEVQHYEVCELEAPEAVEAAKPV